MLEPKAAFLANLDLVDALSIAIARRNGCDGDEVDDFVAIVRSRLVDNDYAIWRKHRGKSSLRGFLSVVIANLFRDHRIAQWGKWRPSAHARRHGPSGVALDRLIRRDGASVDLAVKAVASRDDCPLTEKDLRQIAADLPPKKDRRTQRLEDAPRLATAYSADDRLESKEAARLRERVIGAVREVLDTLPEEDQTILRLLFWEDHSVAQVARTLRMEARPLYRKIKRRYGDLEDGLDERGVDASAVSALLREPGTRPESEAS